LCTRTSPGLNSKCPNFSPFCKSTASNIFPDHSTLRKHYVLICYEGTWENVRSNIWDAFVWVAVDDVESLKTMLPDNFFFKYVSVTSCFVERSFSSYKLILSDKRQSMIAENMEKYLNVCCISENQWLCQKYLNKDSLQN
jgi:hypothetical protein